LLDSGGTVLAFACLSACNWRRSFAALYYCLLELIPAVIGSVFEGRPEASIAAAPLFTGLPDESENVASSSCRQQKFHRNQQCEIFWNRAANPVYRPSEGYAKSQLKF